MSAQDRHRGKERASEPVREGHTPGGDELIQAISLDGGCLSPSAGDAPAQEGPQPEEALRKWEERLLRGCPASFEGILVHDNGRILDANQTLARMVGYTLPELIGMEAPRLVASEWRDFTLQKRLAGCEEPYEAVALRRDGSTFLAELRGRAIPCDGRTVRVVAIRDITERRRAEDALRESEERFRTSVENMLDCFGIYSAIRDESGRIVDFRIEYVNGAACANNLMSKNEQVGKRLLELLPAHRETGLFDEYCRVVETGMPLAKESVFYEDVYREQRLLRAFDIRAARLGDGFAAAWRDITERKRAEEALAYQAQLLASVNDAIISTDEEFALKSWNPAAERIYGWKAEEVFGRPAQEVLRTEFPGAERSAVIGAAVETGNFRGEVVQYRKDGTAIHVESKVIALRDDCGRTTGYVGVNRDISERKRAEEAVRHREAILEAISFAASRFLRATNWDESFQDVLDRLGQATGVSRVYVFENHVGQDGALLTSQRYEWMAPGVEPQMNNPDLHDFPWQAAGFARWVESMTQGEPICGHVREFPQSEQEVLAPQDIKSIVAVPIFIGEEWWGFVGFDECVTEREWSVAEVDALSTAAGVVGGAVQHSRASQALRESEKRYRLLAENASDMIWTVDKNLRFTYVSPSVARIRGYSAAEVMAQPIEEVLTPPSLELARRAFAEELAAESTERSDPSRSRTLELEHICKDGSTVWAEVRMTALRDEHGRIAEILGVSRDITERRRAEEALRESESRYRLLAESASDIIWIRDLDFRTIYVNPASTRIRGYSVEEVMAQPLEEVLTPASAELARQVLKEELARDQVEKRDLSWWRTLEIENTCKDGSTVWLEVRVTALRDDDKRIVGILGISRDISERRLAEEALQKTREELDSRVERRMQQGSAYGLTFRELTVLHLVVAGKSDKEIAATLGISTLTASKHLANILHRMGAASRTEAGVRAIREGLLS